MLLREPMVKKNRMQESELYSSFCDEDWDHIFISPLPDSIHINPQYAQSDLCSEAAEWPSWNSIPMKTHHPELAYDEALEELLLHTARESPSDTISLDDTIADLLPNYGTAPPDPRSAITVPNISEEEEFVVSEPTESNTGSTGSSFLDPAGDHIGLAGHSPLQFTGCCTEDEYKGLRIVHLLIACAEATSGESQDLAEVTLRRLRELVSPTGTAMERVAYYLFQYALRGRLRPGSGQEADPCNPNSYSQDLVVGAFALLHQAFPYTRIAHFTANQSILEAIPANHSKIHIIDFDVMEGMQWPPLMEALVREDFEVREIRMSAVKWRGEHSSSQMCRETGRRLSEYANSVGIAFSFEETDLQSVKDMISENAVVVANCMWQLPHMCELRTKLQVSEFLLGVRRLQPVVLTFATGAAVVGSGGGDFLHRFCHCLQSLCAVFDSLEAGLPHHGLARAMVERFFFGPKMCRLMMGGVDEEEEEEEEGYDCMWDPPEKALGIPLKCGFVEGVISHDNMLRANALLSTLGQVEGCYGVQYGGDHQLVLKWGSAPLVWASSWNSSS